MFLLLFLSVLLLWYLSRWLYGHYWYRGLSVEINFQERFIYEGDTSSMKEILINDKFLPLPALEVRLATSRNLSFINDASANANSTDRSYKRDVFSVLFHQRIERILPFSANKRGFYQIYEVSLTGYDFFFSSNYHSEVPQRTELYVYPRQVDTHRIVMLCQAVSGLLLARERLYPDPFEFSGIREYRKGDPMNNINWKASARSGELMVNQFDSTTSINLTVLFDIEDSLILKYEDLVEETIRIVSSLASRLVKDHIPFYVVGNSSDGSSDIPFSMDMDSGAGSISGLNQKLACIDSARMACSAVELLQKETAMKRTGHTYIFLSKNRNDALEAALYSLIGRNNQILWVFPVRAANASSLTPSGIPYIKIMPWEI